MSAPADLLIDLGHSRLKWALSRDGVFATDSIRACPAEAPQPLFASIEQARPGRVLWSPQGRGERMDELRNVFEGLGLSCLAVTTGSLDLPVKPAYPALGSDRWLALQWPWQQSRRALCVIDCGTAVTVDAVDGGGRHLGGWIMAGLPALLGGLARTAPRLPEPDLDPRHAEGPAKDSAEAIGGGFLLQLIGGIEAALERLDPVLGDRVDYWLTGGNAGLISAALRRPHRLDDHLVLRGLSIAGGRA
jgi:type III pantothenate kinase